MTLFNHATYAASPATLAQLPGSEREVAFAGRSNAGKSSAINTLARLRDPEAEGARGTRSEITTMRDAWDQERKAHELEVKQRDAEENKARDREREDFLYNFKREQQAIKDKLIDEKAALEKEIKLRKATAEKEYAEREKALVERQRELADLRTRAAAFPKELETAVNQAVKETSDPLKLEAKNREELLQKQFEGERNVLATRNDALEKANKDLIAANSKLAQQLEAAYQKVQDIAEKTVEGTSQARSMAELQKLLLEQTRKSNLEKC